MLQDLGKTKEVNLLNDSDIVINPATDDKLNELKILLQAIDENTDQLELKADTVILNVDDLEELSAEIRDTIGQETGSTVLSKLQDLWDKVNEHENNRTEIWERATSTTTTTSQTTIGNIYVVPIGQTLKIQSILCNVEFSTPVGGNDILGLVRIQIDFGSGWNTKYLQTLRTGTRGKAVNEILLNFPLGLILQAGNRIRLRATPSVITSMDWERSIIGYLY